MTISKLKALQNFRPTWTGRDASINERRPWTCQLFSYSEVHVIICCGICLKRQGDHFPCTKASSEHTKEVFCFFFKETCGRFQNLINFSFLMRVGFQRIKVSYVCWTVTNETKCHSIFWGVLLRDILGFMMFKFTFNLLCFSQMHFGNGKFVESNLRFLNF